MGLLDHDAQCLILKKFSAKRERTRSKFKTRLFTTETISYFQELLWRETWEQIYKEQDINTIFNTFLCTYLNLFEASFPENYYIKHTDNAWVTKGIRVSCQRKRSSHLLSNNSNDPKLKAYYKHYCSILRKTIREEKKTVLK